MSNATQTAGNTSNKGSNKGKGDAKPEQAAQTQPAPAPEPATAPTQGRKGRLPPSQQTEEDKKRYAALTLSWGKVARFDVAGRLDKEASTAAFQLALAEYEPYAHVSSKGGPKVYLSVEETQKLAPIARGAFDKFAKPTPDYGKVMNLPNFLSGLYTSMGFDAFADDKDAKTEAILDTLTDKLGYQRIKVPSAKKPGTLEVSSGKSAMIGRIETDKSAKKA